MLNLLSSEHQTLAELAGPLLKRYAKIPETNFSVPDGAGAIKRLEQEYAPNAVAVSHLDGVRIDFKDWWFVGSDENALDLSGGEGGWRQSPASILRGARVVES